LAGDALETEMGNSFFRSILQYMVRTLTILAHCSGELWGFRVPSRICKPRRKEKDDQSGGI
jgi:hypothetical protein